MDVEIVQISERIKRRLHCMKNDAAARSDQTIKQQVEELEALFDMLQRKAGLSKNGIHE